jgi:hypothetical protein
MFPSIPADATVVVVVVSSDSGTHLQSMHCQRPAPHALAVVSHSSPTSWYKFPHIGAIVVVGISGTVVVVSSMVVVVGSRVVVEVVSTVAFVPFVAFDVVLVGGNVVLVVIRIVDVVVFPTGFDMVIIPLLFVLEDGSAYNVGSGCVVLVVFPAAFTAVASINMHAIIHVGFFIYSPLFSSSSLPNLHTLIKIRTIMIIITIIVIVE